MAIKDFTFTYKDAFGDTVQAGSLIADTKQEAEKYVKDNPNFKLVDTCLKGFYIVRTYGLNQ